MSNIYIQEPPTTAKIVMKTSVGDIDLELWTKEAPKACRNFIQLCMEGYYDNTIFHRVVKGFIVQGGDPTGTGDGGESIWGAPFKDEFHQRLRFVRRGLLAMANAGKDDNGSQFFFTLAATPELQNKHTIFGKVTGETVYNMIKLEDALVDEDDRPVYPQKILKTEILTNPFDDIVPRTVPKKKTDEDKGKKKKQKGVKDFKLLSFGEEAEEDEEESVTLSKQLSSKSKSAHDNLDDPKLSSQSIVDVEEPPAKKIKEDSDGSSSDDNSISKEEKLAAEKEKREMQERIKNKLSSKKAVDKVKIDKSDDDDSEGEYYLGKDKEIERRKQTEIIKKQIRDIKRGMKNEQTKKLNEEKEKEAKKKEKEAKSELVDEYYQTQKKYKEQATKIPKKGTSREELTHMLLLKFKSGLKKKDEDEDSKEEEKELKEDNNDEEDQNDKSWISHTLKCEDKGPVLAKDASTKDDDWFEIYDPRNPINKRRRGETNKPKGSSGSKGSLR